MNQTEDISLGTLYSKFCKFEDDKNLLNVEYSYIWEGIRLGIFLDFKPNYFKRREHKTQLSQEIYL